MKIKIIIISAAISQLNEYCKKLNLPYHYGFKFTHSTGKSVYACDKDGSVLSGTTHFITYNEMIDYLQGMTYSMMNQVIYKNQ